MPLPAGLLSTGRSAAEEEADGVTGRRLGGELARRLPLRIIGLYEPPEATVCGCAVGGRRASGCGCALLNEHAACCVRGHHPLPSNWHMAPGDLL